MFQKTKAHPRQSNTKHDTKMEYQVIPTKKKNGRAKTVDGNLEINI